VRSGLPAVFPRLWRYCAALCGRRDWADDLAQATCLRAIEKADGFTPGTHLDRWLFRMAHRIWLNDLRAQKVRQGGGLVPIEDAQVADPRPTSEMNIFATEVLQGIRLLPEAQRVTVLLVYVEGFSYAEAAAMLDIPSGTVMSRLAAARKTLSQRFGDKTGSDG